MNQLYQIVYRSKNTYEEVVHEAFWQFLILPMENESQGMIKWHFTNNLNIPHQISQNGLGFTTLRIHSKHGFREIEFEFQCQLNKEEMNPFDFEPNMDVENELALKNSLSFTTDNEVYLRKTGFSALPPTHRTIYIFDPGLSIFENLHRLNHWVYNHLYFKTGVTDVDTPLEDIIDYRHGVCQDFAHLFCAIAKENGIPARYVSGYIHQGNNYFGDSQMHAWAEAFIPILGWVGFDPTNDILVAHNHIKVCHGKDYNDCAPLKGVVFTKGDNETNYSVKVQSSQQQQ